MLTKGQARLFFLGGTIFFSAIFLVLTVDTLRQIPERQNSDLMTPSVVRGKMIGGFALVAWPADYRNSGVMTFLVSHTGEVFQKDLGPRTARIATSMTSYNPDKTWTKAEVPAPAR